MKHRRPDIIKRLARWLSDIANKPRRFDTTLTNSRIDSFRGAPTSRPAIGLINDLENDGRTLPRPSFGGINFDDSAWEPGSAQWPPERRSISHEIGSTGTIDVRPIFGRDGSPWNQSVLTVAPTKSDSRYHGSLSHLTRAVVDRYAIITVTGSLPRSLRSQ